MCGRKFSDEKASWSMYRGQLSLLDDVPPTNLAPNYNIAPTHMVPVCRSIDGKRTLEPLHWGLLPFWAKDTKCAGSMINARSETLEEKRSFAPLLKSHRCVVPVSGFYEWKREGKAKQAFAIRRNDNPLMLLAGLWTHNSNLDITSYTILTTGPNSVMAEIHDRMPVILSSDDVSLWLDGEWIDAKSLAKPSDPDILQSWMVSNEVGKVANNYSELLAPVPEQNTLIQSTAKSVVGPELTRVMQFFASISMRILINTYSNPGSSRGSGFLVGRREQSHCYSGIETIGLFQPK